MPITNVWQWLAEPGFGNWSKIEILWTFLALVGLILNTVKCWIVLGDLAAAWTLFRRARTRFARDRLLVGWWVVANAVKDEITLLAFVLIGVVAGQTRAQAVDVAQQTLPSSVISGLALVLVELVTIPVVAFTLFARLRLGVRRVEDALKGREAS